MVLSGTMRQKPGLISVTAMPALEQHSCRIRDLAGGLRLAGTQGDEVGTAGDLGIEGEVFLEDVAVHHLDEGGQRQLVEHQVDVCCFCRCRRGGRRNFLASLEFGRGRRLGGILGERCGTPRDRRGGSRR